MKVHLSLDTIIDAEKSTLYPSEFLNSLELSGIPSHKLQLNLNVPVMLMRNLDALRLCNGSSRRITQVGKIYLVLLFYRCRESVIIPRKPIIPTDLPFQFKRVQFPIKLSFAVIINNFAVTNNKAEGQTLQVLGVHLEKPCFLMDNFM
jgi:PIF1 helicase.